MQKSDLKNYRALVREVAQLCEQLIALETSMYSPKIPHLSETPISSGPRCDMADLVARHVELEELYRERMAEKMTQQFAIEHAIDSLDDPAERMVMRYRYIEGRGWNFIIAELATLGYSERQVYRLHGFALLKLKEV